MPKRFSSYRLSETCHTLLEKLAEHLGLSRAAVIEQSVREAARKHRVKAEESPPKKSRKKSKKGD
jgi:predicted transcriptional regulator